MKNNDRSSVVDPLNFGTGTTDKSFFGLLPFEATFTKHKTVPMNQGFLLFLLDDGSILIRTNYGSGRSKKNRSESTTLDKPKIIYEQIGQNYNKLVLL